MTRFFKSLFRTNTIHRAPSRRVRLGIEVLEDRRVMAAGYNSIEAVGLDASGLTELGVIGSIMGDQIEITEFTQASTTRGGTVLIDKIEIRIKDSAGQPRYDASGNLLAKVYVKNTIALVSVWGSSGDDTIRNASSVPSRLDGQWGNDTLFGGSSIDHLFGGEDDDVLRGGKGNDVIHGDSGRDYLMGGEGDDDLFGGSGVDNLFGDAGVDELEGGEDNDFLYGGADGDYVSGGSGNDSLYGEGGEDHLYGDGGNDYLSGGSGNDWLIGDDGADSLWGDDGSITSASATTAATGLMDG